MNATRKPDRFAIFLDSYLEELRSMSDEDVLEGVDVQSNRINHTHMIDVAKIGAGKRRLAIAKEKLKQSSAANTLVEHDIPVAEARSYIRNATNDGRYTLAARELGEMSDDDIQRLYRRLKQLEDSDGKPQT